MLEITTLSGESELLVNYTGLTRNQTVNGNRSLSFLLPKTAVNQHAFEMVEEEALVTDQSTGEQYRIKSVDEKIVQQTPVKSVVAPHVFFDLVDDYRYTVLSTGEKSIAQVMSFVLDGTDWTFSIIDSIAAVKFEDFGNGNALALFNKAIDSFGVEYEINGRDIRIRNSIGTTPDLQFRYNHNVKTLARKIDTRNLSTYIKGRGPQKSEKDTLSGEQKNYDTRSGTWNDTADPIHFTKTVGASFMFSFTGTGVRFFHFADPNGGVWEFVLDGEKEKRISTFSTDPVHTSVDLWRELDEGEHNVIATFKGDDSNNEPADGKDQARGYVRYSSSGDKTIETYRALKGDELYEIVTEYTSPYADRYVDGDGNVKLRHAPPLQSDSVKDEAELLRLMKKAIIDIPEVTIEVEFSVLKDAGYLAEKPGLGDIVPTVYEPLNIDLDLRVMEIEEYPESNKAPKVVLATKQQSYAKTVMNYQKALFDKVYDENTGRLRYNVFDESVKKATEALNNSLTELEYPPGMGIVARDLNDPNRFVAVRSSGIGITTNGGIDFPNAITPDGVTTNLLTAGQIKTNNIQIIGEENLFYWDANGLTAIDPDDPNLYTKFWSGGLETLGMLTVLRKDGGFPEMVGGTLNKSFTLQTATPPFRHVAVELDAEFVRTKTIGVPLDCDIFTFQHTNRYMKISMASYVDDGATCEVSFERGAAETREVLATVTTTTSTRNTPNYTNVVIDLGIPDGKIKTVYWRMRSSSDAHYAYSRIIRAIQEG